MVIHNTQNVDSIRKNYELRGQEICHKNGRYKCGNLYDKCLNA